MKYRLLADLDLLRVLDAMTKRARVQLLSELERIRDSPDRHSDFAERDRIGWRIEVAIYGKHAIHYWIDFPDRQVKVTAITPADEAPST